jgi:hypothetical protein
MDGFHGSHPDFELEAERDGYWDWLDPPSPFAKLLFQAFGPHLDPQDFDVESARWQEVMAAFAKR